MKFIIFFLSLPKTIFFNLKYLPLKSAIRLPIFVCYRVYLKKISGRITIKGCETGMIKIGFGDVSIFDEQRSRTIWKVSGVVDFNGKANIGHGSKISVSGHLSLGERFAISAESSIVASKSIEIGDNVLISWDCLIIDTDFHEIYDSNMRRTNYSSPIKIGNNVWVGCRTIILKGINISEGCIIAAQSTVTKSITSTKSIYAGSPAKKIQSNVTWKY